MEVVRNETQQTPAQAPQASQTPSGSPQQQRGVHQQQSRVRAYSPAVDIFETQESITVHVDVPGVTKEDVTLRLEKNELSVQATRKESLHGPIEYRRTFSLPQDIDGDAIVADLARGVLTLTLPRKASAKPRTIQVR